MKRRKSIYFGNLIFDIFAFVVMFSVFVCTFYPFIYMIMRSFSSGNVYGKVLIWPYNFTPLTYQILFEKVDFMISLPISILRSTLGPVCTLVISYMCAYALAHRDLIGRKLISRFIVFAMYFSAGLLPSYLNIRDLHLNGTFWIYIIPSLLSVYHMILIRTFIEQMPRAIEESALIDGANDLIIAFKILFPLCLPVLAAVILFQFVGQWNAYMDTEIYNAHKPELYTVQYRLSLYLKQTLNLSETELNNPGLLKAFSSEGLQMAMTVIVCIPVVIVYPFLQKYFIKGILIGSVKG